MTACQNGFKLIIKVFSSSCARYYRKTRSSHGYRYFIYPHILYAVRKRIPQPSQKVSVPIGSLKHLLDRLRGQRQERPTTHQCCSTRWPSMLNLAWFTRGPRKILAWNIKTTWDSCVNPCMDHARFEGRSSSAHLPELLIGIARRGSNKRDSILRRQKRRWTSAVNEFHITSQHSIRRKQLSEGTNILLSKA